MKASGDYAALRVVYQHAASMRDWRLTRDVVALNKVEVTVSAVASFVDQFWITQTPADVGLWMGENWWIFEGAILIPGEVRVGHRFELRAYGAPIICKNFLKGLDNGQESHGTTYLNKVTAFRR